MLALFEVLGQPQTSLPNSLCPLSGFCRRPPAIGDHAHLHAPFAQAVDPQAEAEDAPCGGRGAVLRGPAGAGVDHADKAVLERAAPAEPPRLPPRPPACDHGAGLAEAEAAGGALELLQAFRRAGL